MKKREREREREMAANEAGREKKGVTAATFLALAARICDACRASPAILHCRADSAYLCGACDARVHGANSLASRHERTWLCEVCENSPAVVTCKADAASLCAACDADIHSANPLASRHERFPVLPFSGAAPKPPNANSSKSAAGAAGEGGSLLRPADEEDEEEVEAEAASWLLPAEEDSAEPHSATANFFFSNADPYLDLDYATSMDGIKTMSGSDPSASFLAPDGYFDFDLAASKPTAEYSYCHSMSSSEAAVVPDITQVAMGLPVAAARMDREAKVMRYREKRKSRKFQKTIRYASRKAYAEARPRIKGRFAKRTEVEAEVGRIYSSAADAVAALMADDDYGVVPSF